MADLKLVYAAPTEETALNELELFKDKWDSKYPKIYKSWHDNWATLSTYFKYPEAVRRLIYTTSNNTNVAEIKKEELIKNLEYSSKFADTHETIKELSKIIDWSDAQKNELLSIALENKQVRYILRDEDVREFYKKICKENNSEYVEKVVALMDEE